MNAIRCPNCFSTNPMSVPHCQRCGMSFIDLPPGAYVSLPADQIYQTQTMRFPSLSPVISPDNETGRMTFLFYRIYCGILVILYFLMIGLGIFIAIAPPPSGSSTREDPVVIGLIYGVIGAIFFAAYIVALCLPRKPYNWIYGIVMIALGMTSCCFLPFMIPLLIFWVMPETRAYFGRN